MQYILDFSSSAEIAPSSTNVVKTRLTLDSVASHRAQARLLPLPSARLHSHNSSLTGTPTECAEYLRTYVPVLVQSDRAKATSSNSARAQKVYRAWARHRALTPVKRTGLWGSNVL